LQGESENLGEVLSGDRIEKNSLYEVRAKPPAEARQNFIADKYYLYVPQISI
jgi:hypothetical protein